MKKTFSYNDGQVAIIADYSLFQNPTPNEWNEDVYGYGVEWKPGATKVMHDSFQLYAQYQPIYINYYLTCYNSDGQESVQLVSYANRVGNRIEVANFPGIEGFKCWHDINGNIVSVGSYIYMTQTSSLFMSCDFEYELKFDGNGAQGHMDSLSATKHIYIDNFSKNIFVEDAKVTLPVNTFSNDGLFSRSWNIDGNVYGFNELYTLTSSTTAYALWQDPTQYTLGLDCQLVNEDNAFQYFIDSDTLYDDAFITYQSQTMYSASKEKELDFNCGDVPLTPSSEYTLMDYAKGNGGYINLNYIPTKMTKLQFKMRTSSFTENAFIGFMDSNDQKNFRFFATNSSNVYFDLSKSRWYLCKTNTIQSNRWYDIECSQSGMKIDSVRVGTQVSSGIDQIASMPICLFGEASSPIQFDLKHLKIYETSNSINIKARYLQFKIQNYGDAFTEFSELAFFNSSGSQFVFPSATTHECSITQFRSNSEKPEKAIDGLTSTKTCIRSSFNNFTLTYDLKSNALDLSIYNIFKIYAGNDNETWQNRSVKNIEIYAKESDQLQFTLVHSASSIPKQTTNNAVGYSVVLTSNVTDTLKKDIRPAKDKQGRSCLVDVLTGDKFYSANSTDIVCIN